MTRPILKRDDLIVLADGSRALFLLNTGTASEPVFTSLWRMDQDNPRTGDQGSDRPGRAAAAGSTHRSAVEDTDWHRLAKERFAADIAALLHGGAQRGEYGRLVLCAAPMVLGAVRKELHKDVRDRLVAEIDKDFTKTPIKELEAWFAG